MFLAELKFGMGFVIGMSGLLAVVIGLIALAEWVKKGWASETERAWNEMANRAALRQEMVDLAEHAIMRREKVLILLRFPDRTEESAGRRTEYIQ
jgi:hypothetical protein